MKARKTRPSGAGRRMTRRGKGIFGSIWRGLKKGTRVIRDVGKTVANVLPAPVKNVIKEAADVAQDEIVGKIPGGTVVKHYLGKAANKAIDKARGKIGIGKRPRKGGSMVSTRHKRQQRLDRLRKIMEKAYLPRPPPPISRRSPEQGKPIPGRTGGMMRF